MSDIEVKLTGRHMQSIDQLESIPDEDKDGKPRMHDSRAPNSNINHNANSAQMDKVSEVPKEFQLE
jgi:hypothetical protein